MKRVATFLLAAGLVFALAAPASAAPPSSDPITDAKAAAAWLANQVNASGFIPTKAGAATADLSASAQAVTALVAAGVGKTKVTALVAYLGAHVDAFVTAQGFDDPGAIAYLILAAVAGGADPTSFGSAHANLVTRLLATQQSDGLFGLPINATFNGVFDEGLALLALHAVGVANPAGVIFLEGQQCADGAFLAFRDFSNPIVPCPAVDPASFVGADTNSTALAVDGLAAQGETTAVAKAVTEMKSIRTAAGGWGFLSSSTPAMDSQSTGLVVEALHAAGGPIDTQGVSALLTFQIGCSGTPTDQGAFGYQPVKGVLTANMMATVQVVPALAGVSLPITPGTITDGVPNVCPTAATSTTSTTSTTVAASGSTVTTVASSSTTSATVAAAAELPRTGSSSSGPIAIGAACLLGIGALLVGGARRRRA